MPHIDENKLELLIIEPNQISEDEKSNITRHLATCRYCSNNYNSLLVYLEEIRNELSAQPIDVDYKNAEKLLSKRSEQRKMLVKSKYILDLHDGSIEINHNKNKRLLQKIKAYLVNNPAKTAFSFSIAAALIFALFTLVRPAKSIPVFAKIENRVLYVYDTEGKVIWTKNTPGIRDVTSSDGVVYEDMIRYLMVDDIDEDRINEVFIAGGLFDEELPGDNLYCFNYDGTLRWKTKGGDFVEFNTLNWKHSLWYFRDYFTIELNDKIRLFAIACDRLYSPAKLFELDTKTGEILQTYFNSGGIVTHIEADLNKDGKNEIYLGGINNALNSAFISVFNPENISGFSPSSDDYIPASYQNGNELYYIQIPRTDVSEVISNTIYNMVNLLEIGEIGIIAYTKETFGVPAGYEAGLLYHFDGNMKLIGVTGAVTFQNTYKKLLDEGKLSEPLDTNYYNKLKSAVVYHKN